MANLSNYDKTYLSTAQQEQIKALKAQYAAAQSDAERQQLHQQAENIRKTAGYSGGTSGNEAALLSASAGGKTAGQVEQYLQDYDAVNYDDKRGWVNGYSTAMNTRSKANYIRQQMEANSNAWHTADEAERARLHQENLELAKLIEEYAGGAKSTYDEKTGTWGTWNTNIGYGNNLQWTQPNIANAWKEYYGYTDADRAKWDADTSRYHNFVDTRTAARNQVDESSGFTGEYAQFVNGPHGYLMSGASGGSKDSNRHLYADVAGDGFHDEQDGAIYRLPTYDENGNIIKTAPALKNNSGVSDYTNQFTAYTQNGVIMPNTLQQTNPANAHRTNGAYTGVTPGQSAAVGKLEGLADHGAGYVPNVDDGKDPEAQKAGSTAGKGMSGTADAYADYVSQIQDAALLTELAQLKAAYEANLSQLDAEKSQSETAYLEQKRQADGMAAQSAAAWREIANAYGLGSGAIGQAALAQRNQLQQELSTLGQAQTAAMAELERQRNVLGWQYQMAINEAVANYDPELAWELYRKAMETETSLQEQETQYANLFLRYGQNLVSLLGGTVGG